MINIRQSVFETNSSSMHSLVVVKNPKPYNSDELRLNCYHDDQEFKLFGWSSDRSEYGRAPFQTLRTPVDKLRYYVAHELGNCERYERVPELKAFISKCTGVPASKVLLKVCDNGKKRDYYGYVDHNDTGESPFEFIERKGITLEDFILNPKYVVIIDGDEYQEFKQLFESNILNADDFEDISSGADFWNDSTELIYMNWLRPDAKWIKKNEYREYTPEELTDDISSFTKKLVFSLGKDSKAYYNPDKLRAIIAIAKAKSPNIKTKLVLDSYDSKKLTKKDLAELDISMFDEVDLKYHKVEEEE